MPSSMPSSIFNTEIQFLKGVGPRRGDVLKTIGVKTYRDLLWHIPRRYLDRSNIVKMRELGASKDPVTVVGKVARVNMIPRGKKRFEVHLVDSQLGSCKAVWFNRMNWVSKALTVGDEVAISGVPNNFRGTYSFVHPDFDIINEHKTALDTGRIIPLYPGGQDLDRVGLTSRTFRRLIFDLFKEHGLDLKETLPQEIVDSSQLMEGRVALRSIHFPKSLDELESARRRLKFEEFFFIQVMLARSRQEKRVKPTGRVFEAKPGGFLDRFINEVLPFKLTGAQDRAVKKVVEESGSGRLMQTMIQGDVGCGKTVVAIAAILHAIDNGSQAAFMAPTEILAEQHFRSLNEYLYDLGIQVRLLVGGQKKKQRDEILSDIANGQCHVVVGTHAVIQEKVVFRNLGMAIIDEQHRFGVLQRAAMFGKGDSPHVLLMTATPIPRSMAMTIYGDLDVIVIDELPANRKPIITAVRNEKQREDVHGKLSEELGKGRQVYIVYPLVEESEKLDLKDAENGFAEIEKSFPDYKVGMVHGRMKGGEKDEIMGRFKAKELDILVSTTVIEVGVDVPNASIMVIEHAERFGLSQLHQLRGRVGRGEHQSFCVLMAQYNRSEDAKVRLEAMEQHTDGFKISEIDLKLRGAGDFFGTRQSGLPDFKIANIVADQDILIEAREAAFALVEGDPDLADSPLVAKELERKYHGRLGLSEVG